MTVVPLATLKTTAKAVLTREQRPLRYDVLTRDCLADLGLDVGDIEVRKVAEDLREKCLGAGAFGMGYLAQPYCVGYVRSWFLDGSLVNAEAVRIDVTDEIATVAGAEAALRYQHVLNKYGSTPVQHARRIARGFVVEEAVRSWFRARWPSLYLAPDNDRRYAVPCGHDFKLKTLTFGTLTVDVAGPNADGTWKAAPQKPRADLHIIAAPEGLSVVMYGYMSGPRFRGSEFFPEQTTPLSRLAVLLNCELGPYSMVTLTDAIRSQGRLYA